MLFFYQSIDWLLCAITIMSAVKYKFTSKTGGFESYDSHQLLCGGMVEVNSEPFHIAWFIIFYSIYVFNPPPATRHLSPVTCHPSPATPHAPPVTRHPRTKPAEVVPPCRTSWTMSPVGCMHGSKLATNWSHVRLDFWLCASKFMRNHTCAP